ncbi:Rieske 2Fe-2S domain-containing protein [Paenibacillus sp. GCM10012307]|uniref:Rieske 2Fe-2S domain-containing protein n=1 Tax=Paenibacillus roseus TaxID=2798579 RepID=A0A934IVT0_9BACL|nr:Rieske 2Fe-2S domain-containing protein [Paenibacillus roseus]
MFLLRPVTGNGATVAANLLKDYITERADGNSYRELFAPSRFHADPSLKTLIVETSDVVKHLVKGKLEWPKTRPEQVGPDQGAVVTVNGSRAGAYREPNGKLHVLNTTCTHMGCEVEWNEGERS